MKIPLAAVAAAMTLGLSACGSGQVSPQTRDVVEGRVTLLTTRFLEATQAMDVDLISGFLSESDVATFVSDGTILGSAADFRSRMEEGFARIRSQTLEPGVLRIEVMSSSSAVVTGNGVFTIIDQSGQTLEGLQAYTLLWVKTGDDWRLLQAHFSTQPVALN